MKYTLESLIEHFSSEDRKRAYLEALFTAIFEVHPEFIDEIRKTDTIESFVKNKKIYVVLSGNPAPSPDGKGEVVVMQWRSRNDSEEDFMLFPRVPAKKTQQTD